MVREYHPSQIHRTRCWWLICCCLWPAQHTWLPGRRLLFGTGVVRQIGLVIVVYVVRAVASSRLLVLIKEAVDNLVGYCSPTPFLWFIVCPDSSLCLLKTPVTKSGLGTLFTNLVSRPLGPGRLYQVFEVVVVYRETPSRISRSRWTIMSSSNGESSVGLQTLSEALCSHRLRNAEMLWCLVKVIVLTFTALRAFKMSFFCTCGKSVSYHHRQGSV